jgi:predicted MFS family arabinose efflux permease
MERVPPNDLPAHMALHNTVLNLGMLGGSLIGPALGNVLGLRYALLLSAGLRLMAGIFLGMWG